MKQCRTDCIHAEACRRYADNSTYWQNGDCPIYKPTADVVPKSEIEALEKELVENYRKLDESVNFYCSFTKSKIQNCPIDDEVAKAKQEVAREIFEEIGKLIIYRMIADTTLIDDRLITDIAELKKKYTENKGE